jgi:hypothetical protein
MVAKVVGSGVVLGAALAALYFLADRAPAHKTNSSGSAAQSSPVIAAARQPASTVPNAVATAKLDYGAAFAQSRNLWEFAHRILPAAKAGDADAQFYLSKAWSSAREITGCSTSGAARR